MYRTVSNSSLIVFQNQNEEWLNSAHCKQVFMNTVFKSEELIRKKAMK